MLQGDPRFTDFHALLTIPVSFEFLLTDIFLYLRTESAATAIDDAPEWFVSAVGQHVPLQPPPRTGTPPLDLAALPLAHEIVAASLRVDVRRLQ